jgi:hypothetical protein
MSQSADAGDHEQARRFGSSPKDQTSPPGPWMSKESAPIATSTVGLFQGSSGNALNDSTANAANRDIWNVSNMHIHLPQPRPAGQNPSFATPPQSERQSLSTFSYILSTFTSLVTRTAVTLTAQEHGMLASTMPAKPTSAPSEACSEDQTDFGSDNLHASENIKTESGDLEIVSTPALIPSSPYLSTLRPFSTTLTWM